MKTDYNAVAINLVNNWHDNQLRDEGREGLYADDIAGLAVDISHFLTEHTKKLADEIKILRHGLEDIVSTFEIDWSEAQDVAKEALSKADQIRGTMSDFLNDVVNAIQNADPYETAAIRALVDWDGFTSLPNYDKDRLIELLGHKFREFETAVYNTAEFGRVKPSAVSEKEMHELSLQHGYGSNNHGEHVAFERGFRAAQKLGAKSLPTRDEFIARYELNVDLDGAGEEFYAWFTGYMKGEK